MMLSLKREPRFKPRDPRMSASIASAMLLPDGREVPICIRNVSSGGFLAETKVVLDEGTPFGVLFPARGIRRAQVRWLESGMLGAAFETPLTMQELESLQATEAPK